MDFRMTSDDSQDLATEALADLGAMGVPETLLRDVPDLKSLEGLMIYGSRARGDAVDGSNWTCWVSCNPRDRVPVRVMST